MKRLGRRTLLIAAVLCVLAIIVGGTAYGYFFSGQTISNNQVKTGEIKLQLDGGATPAPIIIPEMMPGDSGTYGNYLVENIGRTAGSLYVGITPLGDWDMNLANVLMSAIWLDADQSNSWTAGDNYFVPNGQCVPFAAGDTLGVPGAAYKPMSEWRSSLSNTLNIPGNNVAGKLKVSMFISPNVEDPALMGKSCNFDMLVQIDQYHPLAHSLQIVASTHWGADWVAYRDGAVIGAGVIEQDNPGTPTHEDTITLPSAVYDIVFTQGSWTWTKHIDLSTQDATSATP